MTKKIDLTNISKLAQIKLTDREIDTISSQLESILEFVKQVENIPSSAGNDHGKFSAKKSISVSDMRDDSVSSERSLTPQEALSNSAKSDGTYFVVKGVFE